MGLNRIVERFKALGCDAEVAEGGVNLDIEGKEIFIEFDNNWLSAVDAFYRARQYHFDEERRALFSNRAAEYLIVRLDPGFFHRVQHEFKDGQGNRVSIAPASKEFLLSYFESERYSTSFQRIKDKIHRRYELRARRRVGAKRPRFGPDDFLYNFHTATYSVTRKPRDKTVDNVALERVKACLFALAYKKSESWELSHEIKAKGLIYSAASEDEDDELEIPSATYNNSTVTFYKVAKSSQFPSQVFLSYYHILEYHFLRVADEALYSAVCSQLNDPSFKASYENVNRLLATIKRNDSTVDEKQMLQGVLRRYISEEDFIAFVQALEKEIGEKLFTATKQNIFGESYSIKLEKGHALSSASAVLKHIRNALVHSSDRYAREDCFLPLSESEDLVVKYVPLVKYFAEQVIFATARA
jgi:hypothetical protein